MSIKGLLPKINHAIFADTGWEPQEVYDHLSRLKEFSPIPIHVVSNGDIREYESVAGRNRSCMPTFVQSPNGNWSTPKLRKCTSDFKVYPIEQFIRREILGLRHRQRAPKSPVIEQWYGISVDEAQRMKTSREPWKIHEYPLCGHPYDYLQKTMSRKACLEWLQWNWPYPVPRSSCLGCPFHSDHEWRQIKANLAYWADVVEFDKAIRHSGGMRGQVFLHRSLKPLDEVDLSTAEDNGQLNLFNNDCTGICGV
jgi:hypothetical protein